MTDILALLLLVAGFAFCVWLYERMERARMERRVEMIRKSNAESVERTAELAEAQHERQMEILAETRAINREWIEGQMRIEHPWRPE